MIHDEADYLINAYKDGDLLVGTWHRGVGSRDCELQVFEERMRRGEVDYIIVTDRSGVRGNSYKQYPDGTKVSL